MATSKIQNKGMEYCTSKTFSSNNDYIDITSYINKYSELIVLTHQGNVARFGTTTIPTQLVITTSNTSLFFEVGSYATGTAYGGDRFEIRKSSSTYLMYGGWSFREGTQGNLSVDIYGR